MQKAIVLGATGMVGTQLVAQLLIDAHYAEVIVFVRRQLGLSHPKLTEHVVDFKQPSTWSQLVKGDVLFSTLGTTLAKAGSKKAQFEVDFQYQYDLAENAANNGVNQYILVSSAGANSCSSNFYMSMKGQLEDAVKKLPFKTIGILQPGQLDGDRKESRWAERVALKCMYAVNKMGLLKKYKPIQAHEVAAAMLNLAQKKQSGTFALHQLFDLIQK